MSAMRGRFGRGPVFAVCVVASCWALAAKASPDSDDPASFEYLYIEANEGGSSGGHVALRFGPNVYHFQNRDGLLVLDRERADDFLFSYALLSNRSVHLSRIGVEPAVRARLEDRFRRRFRAQEAQLAVRDALRRDRELLEEAEAPSVEVRGLGYFEPAAPGGGSAGPGPSPALRALRERILARYGATHLTARRRAHRASLEALGREDPSLWPARPPASAYDHPIFAVAWSTRIEHLAAGLAALDVLEQARALDPAARNAPRDAEFSLDPEERRALARYGKKLEGELVDLAGSRREDWGTPFLIGMARLAAIESSLATGRFVFLDSFPEDPTTIPAATLADRRDLVPGMLAETRGQLRASLRHFDRTKDPDELAWERVEERLDRHHELLRAVKGEGDLRLASGYLVPARRAALRLPGLRRTERETARAELARVRAREHAYERRIDSLHHYGLLTHNCVTAALDTLNDEFAGEPEGSRHALGGIVRGEWSLAFIPFVSADEVNQRYRLLGRSTLPSYRERRLAEMRQEEPGFWLALRESNTFTAEAYRRGAGDSFFVFFTEDPVWLRPLLGTINLVAAVGESVWGLVTLPVDRGRTLAAGMRGALVSLPELAFVNIRKGSNDWIAPEYRSLEPEPVDPATSGADAIQSPAEGR